MSQARLIDKQQVKKALLPPIMAAIVIAVGWSNGIGLAFNPSPSMPKGLYASRPVKAIKRGDLLAVCIPDSSVAVLYKQRHYLPESSRCASGLAPLLKPVVAVPGDTVRVSNTGIWVNGHLLGNSRLIGTDTQGRPLPHLPDGWQRTLGKDEYFMVATHIVRSLDSRYFGVVSHAKFLAALTPVYTY